MALSRTDEETRDHVLTGFGDLLESRLVQFLGSRPLQNVCNTCNIIARIVKVTLCSHFFCDVCYQIIVTRKMKCPIDNKEIVHEKVVDIELEKNHMDSYTARCFYASRGCRFWGPLTRVKRHFLDGCYFVYAKCSRCNKQVNRWKAVEHRAECKFGLLQEAIEAIEAVGTTSSTEDFWYQMTEQDGGGCEGTDRASAPAGSGDYAHTATWPSPERYNLDKMPMRKPKVAKRRYSDGARSMVWPADQTSPGDSGEKLAPISEGLPALPSPMDGAQALPPGGKKTSPSRPTTLDVGARRAPRLTVGGLRSPSRGFVTGIACSKPWPGPTGGKAYYAEPVGTVLPSPHPERLESNLHGSMSSLEDLVTIYRPSASSVPSVLSEEFMTAAVASECPDPVQAWPPLAAYGAAARTKKRPTHAKNTEAAPREEPEAQKDDIMFTSTADAWKGVDEHQTSPGGKETACSARAVEVPPCTAYALLEGVSAAESRKCGKAEARARGGDLSALKASSVTLTPPDDTTAASATMQSQEQPSGQETACGIQENVHALADTFAGLDLGVEAALRALSGKPDDLTSPGVASVFRCFVDVAGVRHSLGQSERLLIPCEEGMVSGYTFQLYCLFRRHGRDISLELEFFFTSGDCDDFCRWPFDREVVLRLAHPSDSSKTFRFPLPLSGPEVAAACQRPGRNTSNPGFLTAEHCWDEIEAGGFASDGILRVDVTFE